MYLSRYGKALRRNAALIVLVTIAVVAIAAVVTLLQRPTYSATSKVFVSTGAAASVTDLNQSSAFTQQVVKSYVDVATTPFVLTPVISGLGLNTTAAQLANRVTASAPIDTVVIEITATDSSASRAAAIANSISSRLGSAVVSLSPATASAASAAVKITPLQLAVASSRPTSPSITLNLLLGLIGGAVLGLVLALVRDRLDTRVHDLDDIVGATGASVIGTVNRPDRGDESMVGPRLGARGGEAFRVVRAHLPLLDEGRRHTSFVLTSASAREGTPFVAANLASAIANTGSRVVLVDADLKDATLSGVTGVPSDIGVSDVLSGASSLQDALQQTGGFDLFVLPAGSSVPNAGDLIQSRAMNDLMGALEQAFDVVIYAAPPLAAAIDAGVLAKRTSGVLFVCALDDADVVDVADSVADLEELGATVLGVVATTSRRPSRRRSGLGRRASRTVDIGSGSFKPLASE